MAQPRERLGSTQWIDPGVSALLVDDAIKKGDFEVIAEERLAKWGDIGFEASCRKDWDGCREVGQLGCIHKSRWLVLLHTLHKVEPQTCLSKGGNKFIDYSWR